MNAVQYLNAVQTVRVRYNPRNLTSLKQGVNETQAKFAGFLRTTCAESPD